jgi:hypothetical protein
LVRDRNYKLFSGPVLTLSFLLSFSHWLSS